MVEPVRVDRGRRVLQNKRLEYGDIIQVQTGTQDWELICYHDLRLSNASMNTSYTSNSASVSVMTC